MSKHSSRDAEWERLRTQVLARDPICVYCKVQPSTHVDHIVPKSRGGEDSLDNCVGSCSTCNLRKGAKTVVRGLYVNKRYVDA